MFQYFVTTTLHRSLQLDYKYPKNRPMTDFAESPTEIANLFDNIAYQKCEIFFFKFYKKFIG